MAVFDSAPAFDIPVYIPAGGNPAYPTEFTLPTDPAITAEPLDGIVDDASAFTKAAPFFYANYTADAVLADFNSWFMDRLWIQPQPIEFGNIISANEVDVEVLSTFRDETKVLNNIDLSELGAGVSVTSGILPEVLSPREQASYTLTAVSDGPPQFDGDIIFDFADQDILVNASGIRVVIFSYHPFEDVQEQLSWKTNILRARDGKEQRLSLRVTPRQSFRYLVRQTDEVEVQKLRNTIFTFRPFLFGVPIWWEQRQVTQAELAGVNTIQVDTQDVDHRIGATVLVYDKDTNTFFDALIESFTVSSITFNKPTTVAISANTLVLPVRFAYMISNPQVSDFQCKVFDTVVDFETIDNADLSFIDQTDLEANFTVHPEDSLPILNDANLMSGKNERNFDMRITRLDSGYGLPIQFQQEALAALTNQKRALAETAAEVRRWRSFLHWVRGSWGSFYLPTFRNDVPLDVAFALDASTFTAKNTGYLKFFGLQQPRKSLMLELTDGRQFFAEIQSVIESGGQEIFTLINPFGGTSESITPSLVSKISFLEHVRIDGDVVRFTHFCNNRAFIDFIVRTQKEI